MEVTRSVGTGVETPVKIVLAGALLAVVEGAFDLYNAESYTGVFDGVEVTTGDIYLLTGLGMLFAVGALLYAYRVRSKPTMRAYLVMAVLGLLTLVVGVLFTAVIVVVGGLVGAWVSRGVSSAEGAIVGEEATVGGGR
jgi:hypothetical protein